MYDPSLVRHPDGRVLCEICVEYKPRDEMQPVDDEPGQVWTTRKKCHVNEAIIRRDQWCHVSTPHTDHGVCLGWPR